MLPSSAIQPWVAAYSSNPASPASHSASSVHPVVADSVANRLTASTETSTSPEASIMPTPWALSADAMASRAPFSPPSPFLGGTAATENRFRSLASRIVTPPVDRSMTSTIPHLFPRYGVSTHRTIERLLQPLSPTQP